jgi:hypothetical protein
MLSLAYAYAEDATITELAICRTPIWELASRKELTAAYRDVLQALGIRRPAATVQRRPLVRWLGRVNLDSGLMMIAYDANAVTFVHEIAHVASDSGHDARFASAMAELLEPWLPEWREVAEAKKIRFSKRRVLPTGWHERLSAETVNLFERLYTHNRLTVRRS